MTKKFILGLFVFLILNINYQSKYAVFKIEEEEEELDSNFFYCDLHAHVTLKNFNRDIADAKSYLKNPNSFKPNFFHDNTNYQLNDVDANFGNFDQCTFNQLELGKFDIVVTSLSPLERASVVNTRGKKNWIKSKISPFVSKLESKKFESLLTNSSFNELMAEIQYLKEGVKRSKNFVIINSADEIKSHPNKIKIILSIEGAHALFDEIDSNNILNSITNPKMVNDLKSNILKIKALDTRVFFVTLNHLWWNKISGHAKSLYKTKFGLPLKILEGIYFSNKMIFNKHASGIKYFYRTKLRGNDINQDLCEAAKHEIRQDNGFAKCKCENPLGKLVIEELLSTKNGKRIFLDLRHSDVNTRLDYYNILNRISKESGDKIPIIVSHTAVSGKNLKLSHLTSNKPYYDLINEMDMSFFSKPKYYNTKGGFNNCALQKDYPEFYDKSNYTTPYVCNLNTCKTNHIHDIDTSKMRWFFPWSINLFDEEIKWIYESDGIIGLMAEERLLGAYNNGCQYSNDRVKEVLKSKNKNSKYISDFIETAPLIRNMFHIIDQSGFNTSEAWSHICFSSDFDGLTDPLDNCLTAEQVPAFHKFLISNNGEVFREFCTIYGYNYDFYFTNRGITPAQAMHKFFKGNLTDFIIKYYN